MGIRCEGAQIHLSEHAGDATPGTLVYLWVDEIDPIAAEFDVTVSDAPWGREVELDGPGRNRLRVAQPAADAASVERERGIAVGHEEATR